MICSLWQCGVLIDFDAGADHYRVRLRESSALYNPKTASETVKLSFPVIRDLIDCGLMASGFPGLLAFGLMVILAPVF